MLHKAHVLALHAQVIFPRLLLSYYQSRALYVPLIMTDFKFSEVQYIDNKGAFDEKLAPTQTNASYDEETLKQPTERLDYSGAAAKTDPVEIKLVKKLDGYIMPM